MSTFRAISGIMIAFLMIVAMGSGPALASGESTAKTPDATSKTPDPQPTETEEEQEGQPQGGASDSGEKDRMNKICKRAPGWGKVVCKGVDWIAGGFVYDLITGGDARKCAKEEAVWHVNPSTGNAYIKYYKCGKWA